MTHAPRPHSSAETQIAALEQQLAQAQKLAALGELVSTTTHEFNNVLMTILNYARLGHAAQGRSRRATRPSTKSSPPPSGPRRSPARILAVGPQSLGQASSRPTSSKSSTTRSCCWSAS